MNRPTKGAPLQQQLDAITANTRALVQPERLARTEEVVRELRATNIEERALAAGHAAPGFELPGATGKRIRSADLLALGPVVIKFFRGRWCPYDMTDLEAWQALYPKARVQGALLLAISPQTVRQNAFTVERHHLTFPVLSDAGAGLAAEFGIQYTVPQTTRAWYRSMLVNIPFLNGDETWRLPIPATFVVAGDGTVLYSHADADHRIRPEPAAILASLRSR